jgi:ribosome-binding protein aMBF1 (putative translation factor)
MAKKNNTLEQFRKSLGKQIKQRRQVRELSTYSLAKLINKPQPRIPEIEKGMIKDIDTYMKCIEVLDGKVSITWVDQDQ